MFANKEKSKTERDESFSAGAAVETFIGAGVRFEGRITFNGNAQIDGDVSGEITSAGLLMTGAKSKLQGTMHVSSLIMSGSFQGKLKAAKRLELRAPAHVQGEICTPALTIEDGVVFNGQILMEGEL